jgi:hypothetical protein
MDSVGIIPRSAPNGTTHFFDGYNNIQPNKIIHNFATIIIFNYRI